MIAFTNQAGGVGKSTSVVNIAAFLSKNYKVLVVNADGQQTATMNYGYQSLSIRLFALLCTRAT
ncbi:AAA family ATPase [Bernardetia litoralis]|uniref:AAA family ATPase n=1 Tax=Bernardetia litoralis TaxID=999 RepID=UPI0009DA9879